MFSHTRDDWRIVFRLYRGTLLIILFMFLIGVNVYGWRTSGVNHVLIFELDPRNHLSEQHLMEASAIRLLYCLLRLQKKLARVGAVQGECLKGTNLKGVVCWQR